MAQGLVVPGAPNFGSHATLSFVFDLGEGASPVTADSDQITADSDQITADAA